VLSGRPWHEHRAAVAVAIAQHCGRLIAVWKNPYKNTLHDLNKTGPFP
jgi:hypothetical protein